MPDEDEFSAFVFKIQANMNPMHRDRIAFVRLCSGRFQRGMKVLHVRSGKQMTVHTPVVFLAQDREIAEEAWPGDIVGIPNHGTLHIGDSLTSGEELHFTGIPDFAPELLQRIRPQDPMRSKHLSRALEQLAEEGVARIFRTKLGSHWLVGVVGALQFDVLADRIRTEYKIPVVFEAAGLHTARWVECDDRAEIERFERENREAVAEDHAGALVFLARNSWHLDFAAKEYPRLRLLATRAGSQR